MSSGARLRSDNEAFGRSRTGAFLISLAVPPTLETCSYPSVATRTFDGGPPTGPLNDGNCVCSTFDVGANTWEFRFSMNQQLGLGWEDPPHPAFIIRGNTSGAEIRVPTHCMTQSCTPQGPVRWEFYSALVGIVGVDYGVVAQQSDVGVIPISPQRFYGYWLPGTQPFIDGEDCTLEIAYTPETLPDPGPYNIVGGRDDPQFSGNLLLELDRPVRFTTKSAVHIQNTGIYDGVHEAFKYNEHPSYGVNELLINLPYSVNVTTGTLTRLYNQDLDCWYNSLNPSGPRPSLPIPP